jgi:hypothetical protein
MDIQFSESFQKLTFKELKKIANTIFVVIRKVIHFDIDLLENRFEENDIAFEIVRKRTRYNYITL